LVFFGRNVTNKVRNQKTLYYATLPPQITHASAPQPFNGPFSGTIRVSWCQKKASSGLMVQGRITRGSHTDNLGGCHSIQTNKKSISINPPIFMPDALPVATLPIYPGLGQAQKYAGLHTPVTWLTRASALPGRQNWET